MATVTPRVLLAAALLWPVAAQAQNKYLDRNAPLVSAMGGAWDLVNADGTRRCRLYFNRGSVGDHFLLLGVPTACRASMPQLGRRNGWAVADDGSIHLGSTSGEPALIFSGGRDAPYTGSDGLQLEPVGRTDHGVQRSRTITAAAVQMTPGLAPQSEAQSKLAGRYSIARSTGEAGCELNLRTVPVRIYGAGDIESIWVAQLGRDCRDEGLTTFAPSGWRFDNGRIFLVAKKGHSIGFTPDANRTSWAKDPPAGRPLFLKRAAN